MAQSPIDRFLPVIELYSYLQSFVQRRLWLRVLIGMVLGIGLGAYLSSKPDWISAENLESLVNWIALPGNLFIRIVQMIMIPLMFSSVVQGIAGGESAEYLKKS